MGVAAGIAAAPWHSVTAAAPAAGCHGTYPNWDSAKAGCACPDTVGKAGAMTECHGAAAAPAAAGCHCPTGPAAAVPAAAPAATPAATPANRILTADAMADATADAT